MAAPPLVYSRFKAPEAANGTLDVYEAGSLQNRKTTYSNPGLTVSNTNPVELNTLGEADVFYSGLAQLVLKDSDGDTIWTKDNIGLNGDTSSEWINSLTATYSSSTQFTLSGNQTTEYHVGRRVRLTGSSTLYGTITASSYSAPNTTVTVTTDSGSIGATLASSSTGINSATNTSLNKNSIYAPTVSGYVSGLLTYRHEGGGNSTGFDVDANVTEGAFESVGPTGSSATNIWTPMDSIPSGARIAIITVESNNIGDESGSDLQVRVHARMTGSSQVAGDENRIYFLNMDNNNLTVPPELGLQYEAMVPLDTSGRFDITWSASNETSISFDIYLRGFIL